MKIVIRINRLECPEALRDYAVDLIFLHLYGFRRDLRAIVIRVGDIAGTTDGRNKRCQITLQSGRFGSSTLNELSTDAFSAIARAIVRGADVLDGKTAQPLRQS